MNIKIEAPDFNEVWMQRRDNAVKNAMEYAEQVRDAQEKWLKHQKIGQALNGIVVIVAIVLCVIARNNFPWLLAIIMIAGAILITISIFMVDGSFLKDLDREHQFSVIQKALQELQKCIAIKEAQAICDKLDSRMLEWDKDYLWQQEDIKHLISDVNYLWDCCCALCNTVLNCEEDKYDVMITYADKNGDIHKINMECVIRENYNVDTDILRWEDDKLTFVKKYKVDEKDTALCQVDTN